MDKVYSLIITSLCSEVVEIRAKSMAQAMANVRSKGYNSDWVASSGLDVDEVYSVEPYTKRSTEVIY